MRITITIDTDTNDIKVVNDPPPKVTPVKPEPELPKYQSLPTGYYTENRPLFNSPRLYKNSDDSDSDN